MRPKLQYMSTGAAVTELQAKLNLLMPTAVPPLKVDGKYGDKTVVRVKQFQKSRGLVADGIVGAQTWAAIDGQTAPGPPPAGPPPPIKPPGSGHLSGLVYTGAPMSCTHGTDPRSIKVAPPNRPANVTDCKAVINIPPFGGCYALKNPAVKAANNAYLEAQGPLSPFYKPWDSEEKEKKKYLMAPIPAACSPHIYKGGWTGSTRTEMVGIPPKRALEKQCRADCLWGGIIRFVK